MPELSSDTKKLLNQYAFWKNSFKPKEGVPTIHVDEVASKVAAFYEQIRIIIDWKEEHLMRRTAIIRKLKRRFFDLELRNFSTENVAEPLVLEFIRSGYFPNNKIEESKIPAVQKIIDKYVFIIKNMRGSGVATNRQNGLQTYNQLLEIAACEVEETLAPSIKEMALIEYMFTKMQERIIVSPAIYELGFLKPEEKDIQIYVAVQQALFKLDDPIISYNLIRYKYPQWENPSQEELLKVSQNIYKILTAIERDLSNPLGKKFYSICEKYDTPYLLLGDALAKENFEKIKEDINDPPKLEESIRTAYMKRLADLKIKIKRAAIYSTTSIFITKILSLLVLEIIISRFIGGQPLNYLYLGMDVLIPTSLMALLIITIRPPSIKNLNMAVMETMKIVYVKEKTDTYEIRLHQKRGFTTRFVLSLIYIAGATVSFGIIIWVFGLLNFSVSSIIINIVFIALILFAGTAIRVRSKELTIEEESGGLLLFISDVLLLPITGMGRWMSNKWKRYNVIVVFLNVLIDMPFSSFIEFLERWRYFINERKEDLR